MKDKEESYFEEVKAPEAPGIAPIRVDNIEPPKPLAPVIPTPYWDMKQQIADVAKPHKVKVPGLVSNKQGTQGTYNGIQFDSYWEFAFYLYHSQIRGAYVVRNTTECFTYLDENFKPCKFYPDFNVDGRFYEVKGIFRPKDILKKQATLGRVIFIGPDEIKPIVKEVYAKIPRWKEMYKEEVHKTKLGRKI